ncbi:hypothetical protein F7734_21365 [Scytonema sp. UIC 10036]|uniref:hypothetical protein n=1 Tax=Scytonema sp. UIC 10036 TaxID=2304196 RepID=UPI0012DA4A8F|nr:hypothetical protein [Scytonema sp. UIC 10036]MUG94777.1 hypothetical protein [Scytonema sp. UIC 10036]
MCEIPDPIWQKELDRFLLLEYPKASNYLSCKVVEPLWVNFEVHNFSSSFGLTKLGVLGTLKMKVKKIEILLFVLPMIQVLVWLYQQSQDFCYADQRQQIEEYGSSELECD